MYIGLSLGGSGLDAKGGIVGGTIELSEINMYRKCSASQDSRGRVLFPHSLHSTIFIVFYIFLLYKQDSNVWQLQTSINSLVLVEDLKFNTVFISFVSLREEK